MRIYANQIRKLEKQLEQFPQAEREQAVFPLMKTAHAEAVKAVLRHVQKHSATAVEVNAARKFLAAGGYDEKGTAIYKPAQIYLRALELHEHGINPIMEKIKLAAHELHADARRRIKSSGLANPLVQIDAQVKLARGFLEKKQPDYLEEDIRDSPIKESQKAKLRAYLAQK